MRKAAFLALFLAGCTSVEQIGVLGPKNLPIWKLSSNDFLTASRMLIILDEHGNVVGYVGGTTAGPGTVGLSAASGLATAGAIGYAGKSLSDALRGAKVTGEVEAAGSVHLVP